MSNAMVEVIQDSVIVETNNRGTQSVPSENDGGQNGKTVNVECIEEGENMEEKRNGIRYAMIFSVFGILISTSLIDTSIIPHHYLNNHIDSDL